METGLLENLFAQMLKILIKGLIPVNLSISKDPVLLDLQVCMYCYKQHMLKSVHFKNTVVRSSVRSKL